MTFAELLRNKPKRVSSPTIGWRIRKGVYCLQTDPTTIVVREVMNLSSPKEDWKLIHLFSVTPFDIQMVRGAGLSSREFDLLGITVTKARDRNTDGLIFEWQCPRTRKFVSKVGRFPIQIYDDEVHVSPAGVRVVNEEKRRAFNAKLKEVRNFFRVRAKLGVFDHQSISGLRWAYQRHFQDKSFVDILNDVDVSNLDSFTPLLAWMFRYWRSSTDMTIGDAKIDLLARFNSLVDSERERCKLKLGAITYEVPEN